MNCRSLPQFGFDHFGPPSSAKTAVACHRHAGRPCSVGSAIARGTERTLAAAVPTLQEWPHSGRRAATVGCSSPSQRSSDPLQLDGHYS